MEAKLQVETLFLKKIKNQLYFTVWCKRFDGR